MNTPTQPSLVSEPIPGDPLPLPYRLGDYDLLAVLGRGGMGVVYRARHRTLESLAAVKVLSPLITHHPTARQRFLQEARITAGLRHDGVVRVVHVGEDGPHLYLVMELLEGESLAARLRHGPAVTMADVARIGREAAAALAEAHRQNLIHRDIKPGNVFLETRPVHPPRAKLLDFGIARRGDAPADLTSLNALLGTPQYMAPEQATDSRVGPPADVFGLGCVLYELASGISPFGGGTYAAILRRVAEHDPPPLTTVDPGLPPAFAALVADCLRKDPWKRPTAADVERGLAEIEADPNSVAWLRTTSRLAPSDRRRWRAAALAVVGFAALVSLAVGLRETFLPRPESIPPPAAARPFVGKLAAALDQWKLDDPPPFEEWLKGRKVRTVRQGGGAEFTSLRAALDDLKSGEVIDLLDAGPYTDLGRFPDGSVGLAVPQGVADVGIISRAGAVLRSTKYLVNKGVPPKNGKVCYNGATIAADQGLRLHGLTFLADPAPTDTNDLSAWALAVSGPCVVEDCLWLRARQPRPEEHFVGLTLSLSNATPTALTIRRCWLEGTLNTHFFDPGVRSVVRVENCVFTDAAQNLWLQLGNGRWAFLDNVFQSDDCSLVFGTTRFPPGKGQPEVLLGRNTILSGRRSPVHLERWDGGDLAKFSIGLFDTAISGPEEAIYFSSPQDLRDSKSWAAEANWSSGPSGAPWLDFTESRIRFASQDPLDPGFVRITNTPSEMSEGHFPGAVPPSGPPEWLQALQARRRAGPK